MGNEIGLVAWIKSVQSADIVGDARYIETAWDIQELNTFICHRDALECSERLPYSGNQVNVSLSCQPSSQKCLLLFGIVSRKLFLPNRNGEESCRYSPETLLLLCSAHLPSPLSASLPAAAGAPEVEGPSTFSFNYLPITHGSIQSQSSYLVVETEQPALLRPNADSFVETDRGELCRGRTQKSLSRPNAEELVENQTLSRPTAENFVDRPRRTTDRGELCRDPSFVETQLKALSWSTA
ncbi:hypothetical protein LR48_Vigan316s000200 [Vigna angularis]|uniref:Uncharacterized protein n=1 Tax=Phaseolus angularis TaxID=3914 RepID=A0A0L9T826_PHAAN|nr:hypothetical protein LR48_Vigan316s000200 [Vigna angularis]